MTSRLRSELESEALDVVRTGGNVGDVLARVVTRQFEVGRFPQRRRRRCGAHLQWRA